MLDIRHVHIHPSVHFPVKIGVKRDTLICSVGLSPAGAGLYGLLGRRREEGGGSRETEGEVELAKERETFYSGK